MSSEHSHNNDEMADVDQGALDDLAAMLGDASLWEESDPADEAAIMAAIGELAAAEPPESAVVDAVSSQSVAAVPQMATPAEAERPSNVVSISSARRWVGPFVAGIAAALALVIGVSALTGASDPASIELVLGSTDLAPDAEGVVEIIETPNGTRLLLDVSGLPPAPEGSYYEAWIRQDATVGVSAGTFHLRGGGGEIELWAGVTTDDYPLFTITIQDEADSTSSGQVVLKGLLGE